MFSFKQRPIRIPFLFFLWLFLAITSLPGQAVFKEDTLDINGFEFYYKETGQGKPLVLLHGFIMNGNMWNWCVDSLAKDYRLIIPDMRGHGRSTNPSKEFTHRQYARDVYSLLEALKIDTFLAIGFSSGGMTLLHMGVQQPGRIKAMVVIGAAAIMDEQARNAVSAPTFKDISSNPEAMANARKDHSRGDEQIEWILNRFNAFKDAQGDEVSPEELKTITAQTLIMHGDKDQRLNVQSSALMLYQHIPQSRLWVLPGPHPVYISPFAKPVFMDAVKGLFRVWK